MAALTVGVKVRVLGGPFAGRVGIISELDGKGYARVTLGLLSARVLLENLRSIAGVERPALRSSHHRAAGTDVRSGASRSKKSRSSRKTPPR